MAKTEGESQRAAINIRPEWFGLVDTSLATGVRWRNGVEDQEVWREFKESLVTHGQLQLGLVAKVQETGRTRLIDGSRRFRAIGEINAALPEYQAWLDSKITETESTEEKKIYQMARTRLSEPMPFGCISRPVTSEREAAQLAEDANRRRRDMSPMDLATAVFTRTQRGEIPKDIAASMGFSNPNRVKHLLDFFALPEKAQEALHTGRVTEQLAKGMRGLDAASVNRILKAVDRGEKTSDLTRKAAKEHREGGERVARTLVEFKADLEAAIEGGSDAAGHLLDYLTGRPGALDLATILDADLPKWEPELKAQKQPAGASLSPEEIEAKAEAKRLKAEAAEARRAEKAEKKNAKEERMRLKSAQKEAERKAKKRPVKKSAKPKAAKKAATKTPLAKPTAKKGRKPSGGGVSPELAAGEDFDPEIGERFIDRSSAEEALNEAGSEVREAYRDRGNSESWNC